MYVTSTTTFTKLHVVVCMEYRTKAPAGPLPTLLDRFGLKAASIKHQFFASSLTQAWMCGTLNLSHGELSQLDLASQRNLSQRDLSRIVQDLLRGRT